MFRTVPSRKHPNWLGILQRKHAAIITMKIPYFDSITNDKIFGQLNFILLIIVAVLVWAVYTVFSNLKSTFQQTVVSPVEDSTAKKNK
jgi:uncharacterized membrane protein